MVSRSAGIKIILIALAVLVVFIPFLYPTCRIQKEQLHVSITSPQWIPTPEGAILTLKMKIENNAGCNASIESMQFSMYRLIRPDNTTEDVDLQDTQVIHTTIPSGGNVTVNYAFDYPFTGLGPRIVLAKITLILGDGSSLEAFDGAIDTTGAQQPS
jgi:hypothetical protein